MDLEYESYKKYYELSFHPDREKRREAKALYSNRINDLKRNTSVAEYVWLPLKFEGDMVYIDWMDKWRLEDYE